MSYLGSFSVSDDDAVGHSTAERKETIFGYDSKLISGRETVIVVTCRYSPQRRQDGVQEAK